MLLSTFITASRFYDFFVNTYFVHQFKPAAYTKNSKAFFIKLTIFEKAEHTLTCYRGRGGGGWWTIVYMYTILPEKRSWTILIFCIFVFQKPITLNSCYCLTNSLNSFVMVSFAKHWYLMIAHEIITRLYPNWISMQPVYVTRERINSKRRYVSLFNT